MTCGIPGVGCADCDVFYGDGVYGEDGEERGMRWGSETVI